MHPHYVCYQFIAALYSSNHCLAAKVWGSARIVYAPSPTLLRHCCCLEQTSEPPYHSLIEQHEAERQFVSAAAVMMNLLVKVTSS